MDNNDVRILVEAFIGYRDMLTPIQANLNEFVATYESMRSDIEKLNTAFAGDLKGNLDKIYRTLSAQAEKATDLSSRIDRFVTVTNRYTADAEKLMSLMEKISSRLEAIRDTETKAEAQLARLDGLLEEKRKNYNVKDLEKMLEAYNDNVGKMSDFVNNSVAGAISQSNRTLQDIKSSNDQLVKEIAGERKSLEALASASRETGRLLQKVVENNDVNEAYVYEIIDKWAESRKVRTRKK